jgi:acyl-CoA dehydrogenase
MPDSLPPELIALRERVERLAHDVLLPKEADVVRGVLPMADALTQVRAASKAAGLFYMTQPREFGGTPLGPLGLVVLRDTLAGFNSRLTRAVLGPAPGALAGLTVEPARSRYLLPVLAGERRAAFAFTEAADTPATRARRIEPGDALIVRGQKSYVTGGADADFLTTLVDVETEGRALLVIERAAPGVEVEQTFESIDGSHHAVIGFHDVTVPAGNLIGRPGDGVPRALTQIGDTRLAMAAHAVGLSRWTLDYVQAHLTAPHRSGSPLGAREGVRLRYADLRIRAFAARSMLYRAARLAEAQGDIRNEVMACKIFATEVVAEVVDTGLQLVGGNALQVEHPLARLYQQVRALRLAEGANDVLRINLARGALEFGLGAI